MSAIERDLRFAAKRADIPLMRLMLGKLRDGEHEQFARAVAELPFDIVPATGMTAHEIVRDIRRRRWDAIALDMLNLLPGSSRTEDIDENVRTLVAGAQETGCTIFACQHLNRNRFDRSYPLEPALGDIRGSGQIADLAQNVDLRVPPRGGGRRRADRPSGPGGVRRFREGADGDDGPRRADVFQGNRMRFMEPAEPGTVGTFAA
jgi:replicative DNA helicase